MRCAILAGGLGTRLQKLYPSTIKSMLTFDGAPFIYYQLDLLRRNGLTDIVVCTGNGTKEIEDWISKTEYADTVTISRDGGKPLGTGGAIKKAIPLLGEDFMVIYGDSYLDFNYSLAIDKFYYKNKKGLMTVYHNYDELDKSNIVYYDDRIIEYNKVNKTGEEEYIDYGCTIFKASAFDGSPLRFDLSYIQKQLIDSGEMESLLVNKRFYEVGSLNGIKEFNNMIRSRNDV